MNVNQQLLAAAAPPHVRRAVNPQGHIEPQSAHNMGVIDTHVASLWAQSTSATALDANDPNRHTAAAELAAVQNMRRASLTPVTLAGPGQAIPPEAVYANTHTTLSDPNPPQWRRLDPFDTPANQPPILQYTTDNQGLVTGQQLVGSDGNGSRFFVGQDNRRMWQALEQDPPQIYVSAFPYRMLWGPTAPWYNDLRAYPPRTHRRAVNPRMVVCTREYALTHNSDRPTHSGEGAYGMQELYHSITDGQWGDQEGVEAGRTGVRVYCPLLNGYDGSPHLPCHTLVGWWANTGLPVRPVDVGLQRNTPQWRDQRANFSVTNRAKTQREAFVWYCGEPVSVREMAADLGMSVDRFRRSMAQRYVLVYEGLVAAEDMDWTTPEMRADGLARLGHVSNRCRESVYLLNALNPVYLAHCGFPGGVNQQQPWRIPYTLELHSPLTYPRDADGFYDQALVAVEHIRRHCMENFGCQPETVHVKFAFNSELSIQSAMAQTRCAMAALPVDSILKMDSGRNSRAVRTLLVFHLEEGARLRQAMWRQNTGAAGSWFRALDITREGFARRLRTMMAHGEMVGNAYIPSEDDTLPAGFRTVDPTVIYVEAMLPQDRAPRLQAGARAPRIPSSAEIKYGLTREEVSVATVIGRRRRKGPAVELVNGWAWVKEVTPEGEEADYNCLFYCLREGARRFLRAHTANALRQATRIPNSRPVRQDEFAQVHRSLGVHFIVFAPDGSEVWSSFKLSEDERLHLEEAKTTIAQLSDFEVHILLEGGHARLIVAQNTYRVTGARRAPTRYTPAPPDTEAAASARGEDAPAIPRTDLPDPKAEAKQRAEEAKAQREERLRNLKAQAAANPDDEYLEYLVAQAELRDATKAAAHALPAHLVWFDVETFTTERETIVYALGYYAGTKPRPQPADIVKMRPTPGLDFSDVLYRFLAVLHNLHYEQKVTPVVVAMNGRAYDFILLLRAALECHGRLSGKDAEKQDFDQIFMLRGGVMGFKNPMEMRLWDPALFSPGSLAAMCDAFKLEWVKKSGDVNHDAVQRLADKAREPFLYGAGADSEDAYRSSLAAALDAVGEWLDTNVDFEMEEGLVSGAKLWQYLDYDVLSLHELTQTMAAGVKTIFEGVAPPNYQGNTHFTNTVFPEPVDEEPEPEPEPRARAPVRMRNSIYNFTTISQAAWHLFKHHTLLEEPRADLPPRARSAKSTAHQLVQLFFIEENKHMSVSESAWFRRAIIGGRCQVFIPGLTRAWIYALDVNSLYPWAGLFGEAYPIDAGVAVNGWVDGRLGIYYCANIRNPPNTLGVVPPDCRGDPGPFRGVAPAAGALEEDGDAERGFAVQEPSDAFYESFAEDDGEEGQTRLDWFAKYPFSRVLTSVDILELRKHGGSCDVGPGVVFPRTAPGSVVFKSMRAVMDIKEAEDAKPKTERNTGRRQMSKLLANATPGKLHQREFDDMVAISYSARGDRQIKEKLLDPDGLLEDAIESNTRSIPEAMRVFQRLVNAEGEAEELMGMVDEEEEERAGEPLLAGQAALWKITRVRDHNAVPAKYPSFVVPFLYSYARKKMYNEVLRPLYDQGRLIYSDTDCVVYTAHRDAMPELERLRHQRLNAPADQVRGLWKAEMEAALALPGSGVVIGGRLGEYGDDFEGDAGEIQEVREYIALNRKLYAAYDAVGKRVKMGARGVPRVGKDDAAEAEKDPVTAAYFALTADERRLLEEKAAGVTGTPEDQRAAQFHLPGKYWVVPGEAGRDLGNRKRPLFSRDMFDTLLCEPVTVVFSSLRRNTSVHTASTRAGQGVNMFSVTRTTMTRRIAKCLCKECFGTVKFADGSRCEVCHPPVEG